MIGKTISHYRIGQKLGQGGMGEVWLAQDSTLDRKVALKFLPDIFLGDSERLARFEREAKLLASLNHHNIATIYGLEQADGKRFLAMELVEGETLAQRISNGPLPLDEALEVCRQIAEGVEAAHEKGIIHRDLKPANVKITPGGKVKVLDFGLAKAFQEETSTPVLSHSPTLTDQMTRAGVILGTAAYMSPEQAKGRPVDKRTDIWAFGCVLYECLTGKRVSGGETVPETLARVLEREPDWAALPESTPASIRVLLQRCLRKEARERLHDIADARIELAEQLTSSSVPVAAGTPMPPGPARSSWRSPLTIGLAILSTALAASLIWLSRRGPATTAPAAVTRFTIALPAGRHIPGEGEALALSPDGRELAYAVVEHSTGRDTTGETTRIYLRRFDEMVSRPIPGTESGITPFFSPDGEWLAYASLSDGKVKKVPLGGGIPQALFGYGVEWGWGRWTRDDEIVFSNMTTVQKRAVSGRGATTLLTSKQLDSKLGDTFIGAVCTAPSRPDLVANVINFELGQSNISVFSNGAQRPIISQAIGLACPPTGHLLFFRQNRYCVTAVDLIAAPFDWNKLEVTGLETAVVENVNFGQWAVSESGTLAYASGPAEKASDRLVLLTREGQREIPGETSGTVPSGGLGPRVSPDGKRILIATGNDNASCRLVTRELATGRTQYVAEAPTFWSVWAPDGRSVIYTHMPPGESTVNLFRKAADGSGVAERLTRSPHYQQPQFVTPDGRFVVYQEQSPETGFDLWMLQLSGGLTSKPLLQTGANERLAALAPDGKTLFYRNPSGTTLFALPVTWNPAPAFGTPAVTHGRWARDISYGRQYDVPDSKTLVMIASSGNAGSEITVVLNWFEELRRRVPTGRK